LHENKKITDQIEKLDCIYDEIKQVIQFSECVDNYNPFQNHPEIFFSQREIKEMKFVKLISKGNFGKVCLHNFYLLNILFYLRFLIKKLKQYRFFKLL